MHVVFSAAEGRVYYSEGREYTKGRARWISFDLNDHTKRIPHPETVNAILAEILAAIKYEPARRSLHVEGGRIVQVWGKEAMSVFNLAELAWDYDHGQALRGLAALVEELGS